MTEARRIDTDQLPEQIGALRAGDSVLLSGTVYTARDAAHKRIVGLLDAGQALPFDLKGAVIYYAGPTQAKPGMAIGSCGPTTSGRMDLYAPRLISLGLAAMIGKGQRSDEVKAAMSRYGAVYFNAVGGAGALMAQCVKKAEEIAFLDLGCESVKRLTVEDMPLICAVDAFGGDLFESGPAQWKEKS